MDFHKDKVGPALLGLALTAVLGCQPQTSAPAAPSPAPTVGVSAGQSPTPLEQDMLGALQADVQLDKETYLPGQEISIVAVATGLQESAWVGVVPAAVPQGSQDSSPLDRKTIMGQTQLSLLAPDRPGDYDVRLYESDQKGKEVASRAFKVVADPSPREKSLP